MINALSEYVTDRELPLEHIIKPSSIERIVSACKWLDVDDYLGRREWKANLQNVLNDTPISRAVELCLSHKVKQI